MSGVILDPINSPESIAANFQRLNEALVALQGGSIALSQIVGYEDLATNAELEQLRTDNEKLRYKVGDIHISTSDVNPAIHFGYGVWQLTGSGRTLIGEGTTTDARGESRTMTAGEAGGEYQHLLTVDELPKHRMKLSSPWKRDKRGAWYQNDSDTITEHGFSDGSAIYTEYVGGDVPHNVTQPYLVVYFWKRTA